MSPRFEFPGYKPDPNWNWPSDWSIIKYAVSAVSWLIWLYIFAALLFCTLLNIMLIVRSEDLKWLTVDNFGVALGKPIEPEFISIGAPLYYLIGTSKTMTYFPLILFCFLLLIVLTVILVSIQYVISYIESNFGPSE